MVDVRTQEQRIESAEARAVWGGLFGVVGFIGSLVFCSWAIDATEQRDAAFGDAYRACALQYEERK